ncbi:MAG: CHAT domain-containing protein [Suilimivivens sp.]
MNEAFLLLKKAQQEYQCGNLNSARQSAIEAVRHFQSVEIAPDSPFASAYLNALTLLQSIASRTHDLVTYEDWEPAVKELMLQILGEFAHSYYAVHLLDACECYLNSGDIAKAQQRLEMALSLLEQENGTCPLLSFLHAFYNAKLHFHMEQYHECIASCLEANGFCMEDSLISCDATAFLQHYAANEALISQLACANLILLGCAYGKINNPENGLEILNELAKTPPEDYYLHTSMDFILCELYTRAGMYSEARSIYEQYAHRNLTEYPDLCASLATLSVVLNGQGQTDGQPLFIPVNDGQLSPSTCYSRDAFQILLYNHGLKLIADGKDMKALTLYHQLGDKGLSLNLFLLAKTGNYSSIPACKKRADHYFDCEIRSLFLYYDEQLVHNHLSLLEYHFSLCMDAYIQCHEALGEETLPAVDIYDFLLNTKYISMEAAFLSRSYQTLDVLNNRKAFSSKEIMDCLGEKKLLLEYCITRTVTESFYCVFLITSEKIDCVRLAAQSEIDPLIHRWLTLVQLTAKTTAEYGSLTRELKGIETKLRRLLYRPIREQLSDVSADHLIISPAGGLVQFPFDCLPVSASDYLEDDYEITYINTAKELITNPVACDSHPDSALIIGNPAPTSFPPLSYAEKEAQIAAEFLHSPCYTGKAAVLSLFEPCLHMAPSLMHIAAHGIFKSPATPEYSAGLPDWNTAFKTMEQSGLLLAEDALLSCSLISAMNFSNTRLIILSACETGKGLFHACEGIYGLRRAFRLAGCHSIILSLWQVDDRSGCYFMEQFYRRLNNDFSNAKEAFFLARRALRASFPHPYYWAGYIFME